MISLEQVQLLESRVSKAIEYVRRISTENEELISQRDELNEKLESYQKRIDELEVHIMRFKEDQGRIEDGIIAALDRLSQFEEAFESSLKEKKPAKKTSPKSAEKKPEETPEEPASKEIFFEIPEKETAVDTGQLNDDFSSEGELDIF
jgi:FtsZ-binding cell division protein ZapB